MKTLCVARSLQSLPHSKFLVQRTITYANLYNENTLKHTNAVIHQIYHEVWRKSYQLPPDVQLVLDTKEDNGRLSFAYYFSSHQSRSLFWLAQKNVLPLFKRVTGVESHSHISKKCYLLMKSTPYNSATQNTLECGSRDC